MKIKLVEDKKNLHKTYTVILSVALVILSLLEVLQPYIYVLESIIPTNIFPWVTAIVGILIGVGRYIQQDLSDGKLDGRIDSYNRYERSSRYNRNYDHRGPE